MKAIIKNYRAIKHIPIAAMLLWSSSLSYGQLGYRLEDGNPSREITTTLPLFSEPQTVTVVEVDGKLIYQGDIIIDETSARGRGAATSADTDHRWANSTVHFEIASGHPHQSDIEWAVDHLTNNTNLCMQPRSGDASITDYIQFTYTPNICGRSRIGRKGGRQIVEIGDFCGATRLRGSIMHEVMHAVGFYHEQSRDDRDTYVTINFSNISSGHAHNFDKYNSSWWHYFFPEGRNIGAYDYGSIMHYGPFAFGKPDPANSGRRLQTITPVRSGVTIGQAQRLSAGDIAGINAIYPTNGCGATPSTTASTETRSGGISPMGEDGNINVTYTVELVPQTTAMSCWAAGAAMLVGWNDQVCIDPEEIANGIGYWSQYHLPSSQGGGLPPDDMVMLSYWGLTPEAPQSYTVEGFADMLASSGPLWVAAAVPGPHIRVVAGIQGDGTPQGTVLTIYDPWQQGMSRFRSPNSGSVYTETYQEFVRQQEDLAISEMNVEGAIYVAHF